MVFAGLIFILLLSSLASWLMTAAVLCRWARWMELSQVTFRRSLVACLLATVIQWPFVGILLLLPLHTAIQMATVGMTMVILILIITGWIFAKVLRIPAKRAAQGVMLVILTGLVLSFATQELFAVTVRPYLYETFKIASNSMAPTALGAHAQTLCPTCGSPAYGTAPFDKRDRRREPPWMICESQFHTFRADKFSEQSGPVDRVLVCKFLQPKRWDVICFESPDDPNVPFIHRVVGLPGEEVTIRDGSVWINGQRQKTPEHLQGLQYTTDISNLFRTPVWGDPRRPAQLGPDEYFVLGDFTQISNDSRLWERDLPNHSPFAVPASQVSGVMTHRYWPLSRWKSFP